MNGKDRSREGVNFLNSKELEDKKTRGMREMGEPNK